MDDIEIPGGHALVQLSRTEILALWKALANVRNSMDVESVTGYLGITPKEADELTRKLREAR